LRLEAAPPTTPPTLGSHLARRCVLCPKYFEELQRDPNLSTFRAPCLGVQWARSWLAADSLLVGHEMLIPPSARSVSPASLGPTRRGTGNPRRGCARALPRRGTALAGGPARLAVTVLWARTPPASTPSATRSRRGRPARAAVAAPGFAGARCRTASARHRPQLAGVRLDPDLVTRERPPSGSTVRLSEATLSAASLPASASSPYTFQCRKRA
jgi:hypothetical protein